MMLFNCLSSYFFEIELLSQHFGHGKRYSFLVISGQFYIKLVLFCAYRCLHHTTLLETRPSLRQIYCLRCCVCCQECSIKTFHKHSQSLLITGFYVMTDSSLVMCRISNKYIYIVGFMSLWSSIQVRHLYFSQ